MKEEDEGGDEDEEEEDDILLRMRALFCMFNLLRIFQKKII